MAKLINSSPNTQRVEFLNEKGEHDSHPIPPKDFINIDEESITTSQQELTKRRLKIVSTVVVPTLSPSVPSSTGGNNNNSGGKQHQNSGQNKYHNQKQTNQPISGETTSTSSIDSKIDPVSEA